MNQKWVDLLFQYLQIIITLFLFFIWSNGLIIELHYVNFASYLCLQLQELL